MISLQKDPSRDFLVLNITDPQLDESYLDENSRDCRILFRTIDRAIEKSNPDLITISGDFGYGDDPAYLSLCQHFGDFIEQYQIPWAAVWGNHDHQGGREQLQKAVQLFRRYPHFLYEEGEEELGNGNYVICIEENGRIVQGIVIMDTHDRWPYMDASGKESNVWAKLLPPQLDWYEKQILMLQNAGCENTVLITHIPIYAYKQAFAAAFKKDFDPKKVTVQESYSGECWNDGYKDSFGVRYEEECSYPEDEGAFDVIQKLKSTKVVLCGHDHVNCWNIGYKGVRLVYALKTGRGCYYHKDLNGGTVLKIHSAGPAEVNHIFIDSEEWA